MSVTSIYTTLKNYSVSGVTNLSTPPNQLNTAQLPVKFVQLIESNYEVAALNNSFGLTKNTFDVVYVIEPVLQNTIDNNLTSYLSIVDNISTFTGNVSGAIECNVSYRVLTFGNTLYHTLIQRVVVLD